MKKISYPGPAFATAGLACLALMIFGTGGLRAQTAISADGVVESTSGGFRFPDGSVQTSAATAGSAPVEVSGANLCFDQSGTQRNCSGTGEDGELQAGAEWPAPRFTDNGDGTVTDNLTGLIWLKDAHCPGGTRTWQGALDWVDDLNSMPIACSDYAAGTFTDWRLPNVKELLSLADYGEAGPALPAGNPFVDVQFGSGERYWSSTSPIFFATNAFTLFIDFGGSGTPVKTESHHVWPVRGGA